MRTRTNPFFLVAGLYFTVALFAVVTRIAVDAGVADTVPRLRWLTIHFVTIGGMTQALFGALPSLAGDDAETTGRWGQWVALNAGYPFVLLGVATGAADVAAAGATAVLVALAALVWSIARRSGGRTPLARFYRVGPWFLAVGILAAFGMLFGVHGPGGYFGTIEAHVHANVWGFLALVVAGTLLAVVPVLADRPLDYPRLVPVAFWGIALGAVGLVAGPWLARHELTFAGLAAYVVGTLALLANVVGTWRRGAGVDARLGHVVGAYVWLVFPVPWAPFVLLFPDLLPATAIETAAIDGLVFGWMLQLAMAFLPVLVRSTGLETATVDRETAVAARPSWLGVVGVNAGVAALWASAIPVFGGADAWLPLAGFALIAGAWTLFVVHVWQALSGAGTTRTAVDAVGD